MKLLIFLLGLTGGAGGATAWLLSEPSPADAPPPSNRSDLQARLDDLKARWSAALDEGRRAGQQTEEGLRRQLDDYRRGAPQPTRT